MTRTRKNESVVCRNFNCHHLICKRVHDAVGARRRVPCLLWDHCWSQHANQWSQAPAIELSIVTWCSWMALEHVIPSVWSQLLFIVADIVKRSVNIHGCDCQQASWWNKSNISACGVSFICLSHCVSRTVYLIWLLMVWSTWSNLTTPLTASQ